MTTDNRLVTLRAPEPSDLDMLYELENDSSAWETGCTAAPVSRDLLRRYIESAETDITATRQLRMMIVSRESDEAVGTIDMFNVDILNRRAEIGIAVTAAHRRRGYALEALAAVASYAARYLGMHQLYATIAADNAASRALFSRAGYKTSGRMQSWLLRHDGVYEDAYICQLMLTRHRFQTEKEILS